MHTDDRVQNFDNQSNTLNIRVQIANTFFYFLSYGTDDGMVEIIN